MAFPLASLRFKKPAFDTCRAKFAKGCDQFAQPMRQRGLFHVRVIGCVLISQMDKVVELTSPRRSRTPRMIGLEMVERFSHESGLCSAKEHFIVILPTTAVDRTATAIIVAQSSLRSFDVFDEAKGK